jgi:predicted glycogen debranching enzyme
MTIDLGPQVCGSLAESSSREWLVADGTGGYAMGTVAGLRTRRYHGLLVVAVDGPARRMLGLAALDPVLVLGDSRIRLATDEWADGSIDPRGHELLATFDLTDGVPRWRWQVGAVVLEREVAAVHGSPAVGIVHRLIASDRPVSLELSALCTWRDVHGERFANGDPAIESDEGGFLFEGAYRVEGEGWRPGGEWYRGVRAREEAARGLNDREDLWAAGTFRVELEAAGAHEVTAAAMPVGRLPKAAAIVSKARKRARNLVKAAGARNGSDAQLVLAGDQFAITTGGRPTAVAGYPWFGEWSRDLMTSYEGLYLATNRHDEGRQVLLSSAGTVSEGMLANTADTGTLEYNTVDGTLWFVHAVGRHVSVTADADLGHEVASVLDQIVDHHLEGTRFGISVDPTDGLLRQGVEGWALTWMDARIDGVPVTPRIGKPVEVNALWLRSLEVIAELTEDAAVRERCVSLHQEASTSFARRYPRPDGLGLYDVVDGPDGDDASLRPNQLLGVTLASPALDTGTARSVVDVCSRELLTPLGLRSLAPDDPRYRPHHRGSPAERDAAYHEGTVWPWLLGPYADAAKQVGLSTDGLLDGIQSHLGEWGLGSISETADGAAPHAATGCPFQAWSVAELLRISREPVRSGSGRKKAARALS